MGISFLGKTIIDFATAKGRLYRRRTLPRRPCYKQLFAQVTSCVDSNLLGATLSGLALDASGKGLRIKGHLQVPARTRLELWVDTSPEVDKCYLISEVRWVRNADNSFEMGVELQEDPITDIDAWRIFAS